MHRFLGESPGSHQLASISEGADDQHATGEPCGASRRSRRLQRCLPPRSTTLRTPARPTRDEIRKDSPLAVRYHDDSVLESHHLAAGFAALLQPEHNFLAGWTREDYMDFRALVIKLVLMTDLSKHFEFVERLKQLDEGELLPRPLKGGDRPREPLLDLTIAIKYADLSNA